MPEGYEVRVACPENVGRATKAARRVVGAPAGSKNAAGGEAL